MSRLYRVARWTMLVFAVSGGGAAHAQDGGPVPAQPSTPSDPASDGLVPPSPSPAAVEAPLSAEETATNELDEASAATQVASFAVTQLKDSPAVVTVISGEDVRNAGARDLIDVLMMVPGFFSAVDTLGVVGPGFRGLWGHEGKILLMIDGKEMIELLFSSMQLGNEFPIELIERVEVVRGPGSVIYGGSAELAVINVVTRGVQGSTDATFSATYGQLPDAQSLSTGYGRRKLTVSGRYVVDAVPGLSLYAAASSGQGQRSARLYTDNTGMSASMEGQSSLNPTMLQLALGYKDAQASLLYHHLGTTTISGFGSVLDAPAPVTYDAIHGELVGTIRPTDRTEIVPRFNLTYQKPWASPESAGDAYYNKSVRRMRGRLLGRWAVLDQLQITAGGDAIFDRAQLESPAGAGAQVPFGTSDRVSYEIFAGYMELYSENPYVNISAGARYDHHSTVGGALVPRIVLLRSFGNFSLKGLFSLSFRGPGIENINLGTDLRPERTRVFEFEGSVDLTPQQRLSANVFDVNIEAPIAYAAESYLNLGRQGTRGFEASYRLRYRLARIDANYSFYRPTTSENTPNYVVPGHAGQFLAAPAHRGSLRANFRLGDKFGITPSAIFLGPHFARGAPSATGAPTAIELSAQVLANLFVYVDDVGMKGLRLGLGLYNIFGSDFRFARAAAVTPADATPGAATDAYLADHAPLPGLDREVLLQLAYMFEPS